MIILNAFFVMFLLIQSTKTTSTTEQIQIEGLSVESKYSLPNVNVSAGPSSGNFSDRSYTVKPSLSRVLDFYNTELLAASWNGIKKSLSEGCQKDVEAYIEGMSKAENWALKSKFLNIYTYIGCLRNSWRLLVLKYLMSFESFK